MNRYLALLVLGILIWSTSFVGTKLAYETFPPLTLGAARFVIALLALGAALVVRREYVRPAPRELGLIYLSGVLGITVYYAMENIGVSMTSAANSALIVSATPTITLVLERLIYGVRITKPRALGIVMAMTGVYLITAMAEGEGGSRELLGCLILVGAGVVWAFYNFVTRKVVNKYPAFTVSFHQTLAGTVLFVPLAFIERDEWRMPTATSFAMLVYLALFCSVAAFMLYNYGLRRLSAGTAALLLNLVPVFGVALSVIVLGETLWPMQLIGGVIVILGVILSVKNA